MLPAKKASYAPLGSASTHVSEISTELFWRSLTRSCTPSGTKVLAGRGKNGLLAYPLFGTEFAEMVELCPRGFRYPLGLDKLGNLVTVTVLGELSISRCVAAGFKELYFKSQLMIEEWINIRLEELSIKQDRMVRGSDNGPVDTPKKERGCSSSSVRFSFGGRWLATT